MDSKKDDDRDFGSSDCSSALLHTMKVTVDELNYMIAFQGDMSVNLADADSRKQALHAKKVLENTKDRIVNRILNEADQLSKSLASRRVALGETGKSRSPLAKRDVRNSRAFDCYLA